MGEASGRSAYCVHGAQPQTEHARWAGPAVLDLSRVHQRQNWQARCAQVGRGSGHVG